MSDRRQDQESAVRHPRWCDRSRCTAKPGGTANGVHRGAPARYVAKAALTNLEVTASLCQGHAPWLTEQYVDLEFVGLEQDWKPINGAVHVTADQAVELGRFLTRLGEAGTSDYSAQVQEYLSRSLRGGAGE